jgi:hypothetical protein
LICVPTGTPSASALSGPSVTTADSSVDLAFATAATACCLRIGHPHELLEGQRPRLAVLELDVVVGLLVVGDALDDAELTTSTPGSPSGAPIDSAASRRSTDSSAWIANS